MADYEYNSGPITSGAEEIGYFFEEEETIECGEETLYSFSRWEFSPDGTFTCNTQRSWESWDIPQEGLFERSRYEEFVNQMKELKTDWMNELTYIPFDYEFKEGLAKSQNNDGKWGFMDKTGGVVIPYINESAGDFHEGLAGVQRNKKWGFVDKTGREVIPCIYDDGGDFHEGLAGVERNKKWGFVDNTGREVIPCIYDDVDDFHENLARVECDKKWGFVDNTGREVVPCIYDDAGNFQESIARVARNKKWGFVDSTGSEVIPCIYDNAGDCREGLARVARDKKWGFIDNTGREVIPCQYEEASDYFEAGARIEARVKENGTYIFIDKTGQIIVEKKTVSAPKDANEPVPDDDLPF